MAPAAHARRCALKHPQEVAGDRRARSLRCRLAAVRVLGEG